MERSPLGSVCLERSPVSHLAEASRHNIRVARRRCSHPRRLFSLRPNRRRLGPLPWLSRGINGNGIVNTADLIELLGNWGPCP